MLIADAAVCELSQAAAVLLNLHDFWRTLKVYHLRWLDPDHASSQAALEARKLKFTGLTQTLGQL